MIYREQHLLCQGCAMPWEIIVFQTDGTAIRSRTGINQLSVATGYKPVVLPLNYGGIYMGQSPDTYFICLITLSLLRGVILRIVIINHIINIHNHVITFLLFRINGSGDRLCSCTSIWTLDFKSSMSTRSITPPYSLAFISTNLRQ